MPRLQTLDRLEQILERIENTMYVRGYDVDLARLYQRTAQFRQNLAAVNVQLFTRLRAQLVADPGAGRTLQQLCTTYIGPQAYATPRVVGCDENYLDVFVNGILGVEQPPEETLALSSGMIGYVPTPTRVIFALLDQLALNADDVFYDVGAGLGRVALLAGWLSPARATGIEIEPAYCHYAQQRAAALHLPRVTFVNKDARAVDYTGGTVFFLYTPCTGPVLQAILDQLHLAAQAQPITIVAYGLCTEHVSQQPWLHPTVRQAYDHDILALFSSRAV
jgi:SAM-dependent methyltransferase